jgi:drug/metabolite transporter (DMT)-like permease
VCATVYAVYIHALQKVLRHDHHDLALAFLQVAGIAACALATLPLSHGRTPVWSGAALGAVVVCALLATVGTFWLQTRFQGRTTPQRVALIFAMEPVFAAMFAYLLLNEIMTARAVLGASIILGAVIGAEVLAAPPGRKPPPT